jgi:hypothetical protein
MSAGRVAGVASAAPDAGRLGAIPGLHQEEVRDSPSAAGRGFPSAMPEKERLVLPQPQNERERRRAQLPQDAPPKAAYRLALLVSQAPQAEWVSPVARWQATLASPQTHADESVLPQAQPFPALRASHSTALAHEAAPWVPLEQLPGAPPVLLASPLARREMSARLALLLLAPH